METKMKHLIAVATFAAMAASGSALADPPSPAAAADKATSAVTGAKDEAKDAKTQGKAKKNASTPSTGNPISVTPPSADNPQTAVDVNTDPAKAHADAGPEGVNANANIDGNASTKGKNPAKPVTDKLAQKKDDLKKQ